MNHLICALLATAAVGAESDAPKPGDEMIEKYLQQLTLEQSARFLDGAETCAEWEAKLPRLRQEYLDMLGLWPLPEKTPLKPTVTGTVEHADVVIEKLHFQSRPGLYVTGNLYRPKASREREQPEKLPRDSLCLRPLWARTRRQQDFVFLVPIEAVRQSAKPLRLADDEKPIQPEDHDHVCEKGPHKSFNRAWK